MDSNSWMVGLQHSPNKGSKSSTALLSSCTSMDVLTKMPFWWSLREKRMLNCGTKTYSYKLDFAKEKKNFPVFLSSLKFLSLSTYLTKLIPMFEKERKRTSFFFSFLVMQGHIKLWGHFFCTNYTTFGLMPAGWVWVAGGNFIATLWKRFQSKAKNEKSEKMLRLVKNKSLGS